MPSVKCCPTCQQPLPPKLQVGGKRRQALLDYVLKHPHGVTRDQIMDHVWADDPNGGPDARTIISVMIRQINAKLRELGEPGMIRGARGAGAIYKALYL